MVRNELFANTSFIGTNYTNIVFANRFLNTMYVRKYIRSFKNCAIFSQALCEIFFKITWNTL